MNKKYDALYEMNVILTKQISALEEEIKQNKEKTNVIEFRLDYPKGYTIYETISSGSFLSCEIIYHQTLAFYHKESNSVKRVVFYTHTESLISKIEQEPKIYIVVEQKNDYEIILKGKKTIVINGVESRIFIDKDTGEKRIIAVSSLK